MGRDDRRVTGKTIGVLHFGLGPIGQEIARVVAERARLRSVAAIDIDPTLEGRSLSEVLGLPPSAGGPSVRASLQEADVDAASVAAHSTSSSLVAVAPQLFACVRAGLSVASTCEQLAYPWAEHADLAAALDAAARDRGVAIIGTGVNPGFAMDYVPVVLSGAARSINAVRVHRVQDAAARRLPLQQKVGAGLTVDEFDERVRSGSVRHVGLPESLRSIAAALEWALDGVEEQIEPVLADRELSSAVGPIPRGAVAGVRQVAIGRRNGDEAIRLTLEMAVGLESRDEIELDGDPPLHLIAPSGLPGDVATAAVTANVLSKVVAAHPGLHTMPELAPPRP
jgi:hypothetical protein